MSSVFSYTTDVVSDRASRVDELRALKDSDIRYARSRERLLYSPLLQDPMFASIVSVPINIRMLLRTFVHLINIFKIYAYSLDRNLPSKHSNRRDA